MTASLSGPARSLGVRPGGDVFVVEEQANPSSDYFVRPALREAGCRIHMQGFAQVPPAEELQGASVVFVRYLPAAWRAAVEAQRGAIASVVLFIDDDLLDARAAAGMPWRYRYKLYTLATRHRAWLRAQRVTLWVSTPWLAHKYAEWAPLQVAPRAPVWPKEAVRIFYHGTASHDAEVRWLRPVIEQVLHARPQVVLEIVGGADVHGMYRSLPRVMVIHPMKWPAYQAFMDLGGRDIGLAPLLPLAFNQARSCTKFFDITRCGGAGLFAAGSLCADLVQHERDGLVLPMDASTWVAAILRLVDDAALRQRIAHNARARLLAAPLT